MCTSVYMFVSVYVCIYSYIKSYTSCSPLVPRLDLSACANKP